jgi:hypothetical protein
VHHAPRRACAQPGRVRNRRQASAHAVRVWRQQGPHGPGARTSIKRTHAAELCRHEQQWPTAQKFDNASAVQLSLKGAGRWKGEAWPLVLCSAGLHGDVPYVDVASGVGRSHVQVVRGVWREEEGVYDTPGVSLVCQKRAEAPDLHAARCKQGLWRSVSTRRLVRSPGAWESAMEIDCGGCRRRKEL